MSYKSYSQDLLCRAANQDCLFPVRFWLKLANLAIKKWLTNSQMLFLTAMCVATRAVNPTGMVSYVCSGAMFGGGGLTQVFFWGGSTP